MIKSDSRVNHVIKKEGYRNITDVVITDICVNDRVWITSAHLDFNQHVLVSGQRFCAKFVADCIDKHSGRVCRAELQSDFEY